MRFVCCRFSPKQQQQAAQECSRRRTPAVLSSDPAGSQTYSHPWTHPGGTHSQRCQKLSRRHELPFSLIKKPEIKYSFKDRRPLASPRRFSVSSPTQPASAEPPFHGARRPQQLGVPRRHPHPGHPPAAAPGPGRCPQGPASPYLPRRRAGRHRVAPRCQGAITPTPSQPRRPPCEHGHP